MYVLPPYKVDLKIKVAASKTLKLRLTNLRFLAENVAGSTTSTAASQPHRYIAARSKIKAVTIMSFLKANDGVNLHYKTYGSSGANPLIFVSAQSTQASVFLKLNERIY